LLLIASFGVGCNFEGTLYAEQYREQANRICAQFARKVARIPAPSSSGDFRRYLRRRALVAERLTDFGRPSGPPDELDVADAEMSRVQAAIQYRLYEALERMGRGGDASAAYRRMQPPLAYLLRKANALARDMGVDECRSSPGAGPSPPVLPPPRAGAD
jgi:hypothetical protein